MTPRLRVAVAGLGAIGMIHARNARASDALELVAVASSDPERARAAAASLGAGVAAAGLDGLFEAAPDAVVVASQTHDHLAYARRVLEHGRHLFLEKPGAVTLAAHAELSELARASGVVVVTGYMRRFDPGYAELKRRVDAGAVGTPSLVSLTAREAAVAPAVLRAAGGFIVDLGVHDFDVAAWILGQEPVEAYAAVQRTKHPGLAFDSALVVVRFDGGGLAHVHLSCTATAGHDLRCDVVGTEGSIALRGLDDGVASLEPVDAHRAPGAPQDFAGRFAVALRAELDAFAARCAGEQTGAAGLLEDRRALAVGVAARASAERRTPLAVGPDWPWFGPM